MKVFLVEHGEEDPRESRKDVQYCQNMHGKNNHNDGVITINKVFHNVERQLNWCQRVGSDHTWKMPKSCILESKVIDLWILHALIAE